YKRQGTGYLGEATAYEFLKNNYNVIINSRKEDHLLNIKKKLEKYGRIDYIAQELKDDQSCKSLSDKVKNISQNVDALVITIGGYIEDTVEDLSGIDEMFKNHLKIPMLLIKNFLNLLTSGSSIILVSNSDVDNKNRSNLLSYTVIKYALNKSVKIIAAELIKKGVRINAVAPEYIIQSFMPEEDYTKLRTLGDLETPPEDISKVIYFLCSPDGSWVNGAIIPVDGGHSLIN
ncbi:SDR family oxidoreductase, partial [Acidiplasma aeolicum]|uniref:SDR family oxidoreductase n=1 Tax=Acidiplasma aeolicum TaxID=507754 RepID=UPI000AF8DB22